MAALDGSEGVQSFIVAAFICCAPALVGGLLTNRIRMALGFSIYLLRTYPRHACLVLTLCTRPTILPDVCSCELLPKKMFGSNGSVETTWVSLN